MTLRLRLALGLAVLLAVGFGAFSIATYSFFAPSITRQLDTVLRNSAAIVGADLEQRAGLIAGSTRPGSSESSDQPTTGEDHKPSVQTALLAPGSYGELISPSGKVVASEPIVRRVGVPDVSRDMVRPLRPGEERFYDSASVKPSGPHWRVLVTAAPNFKNYRVVLAAPTTNVENDLHDLVLIELGVALGLLVILLLGSYLLLRRGLQPLEKMADDAHAIAEGDLAHRVSPGTGAAEVIELGSALNAMLAEIERGFAERDATEARLRRFLADVSHELRTPLTSILGFAELFRLGRAGGGELEPAVMAERIEAEARRMRRLVNDLMLLARLDQAPEVELEPVDLSVVAADACTAALAADPGRPISLEATDLVVTGDKDHIRRAVTNLLSNATTHTPAGSPIEVRVAAEGKSAVVSVRDHGAGLDEEALTHALDRFWRADTARAGEGAGLGLSIVQAIAAEHGGSLELRNAEGGGAVFSLRLPLSPKEAEKELLSAV